MTLDHIKLLLEGAVKFSERKAKQISIVFLMSTTMVVFQYMSLGFVFIYLKTVSSSLSIEQLFTEYGLQYEKNIVMLSATMLFLISYMIFVTVEYLLKGKITDYIDYLRRQIEIFKETADKTERDKINTATSGIIKVERGYYSILSPLMMITMGMAYIAITYPILFILITPIILISIVFSSSAVRIHTPKIHEKTAAASLEITSYTSKFRGRIFGGIFFTIFLLAISFFEQDIASMLIIIVIGRLLLANISNLNFIVQDIANHINDSMIFSERKALNNRDEKNV